ncbi:hypothetical protein E6C27_scaffold269G002630 [Cucumis melo var. makuwa]|uniref:Uncharacterized protein n=1 Tax=Cucumis melo var. makuwa TaxID=1194695 RepID=A0A5A7SVE3_CUCMM|nr:hypothetical protein E6C27_scaffold269G002630 [Cucumis melo var. makuwa]
MNTMAILDGVDLDTKAVEVTCNYEGGSAHCAQGDPTLTTVECSLKKLTKSWEEEEQGFWIEFQNSEVEEEEKTENKSQEGGEEEVTSKEGNKPLNSHVGMAKTNQHYRKWNQVTVSYKLPISMTKELLDELLGAAIFSNLDLPSRGEIDGETVRAMVKWPPPKNVSKLRGLLGLTGYYGRLDIVFAQNMMKKQTDLHQRELNFQKGEEGKDRNSSLSSCVTTEARIHNVFQVSQLKLKLGQNQRVQHIPPAVTEEFE